MPTIHAIIPAAGKSGRMGRPKQLMEIDGRPMLLAVVEPIAACDRVAGVVVVTNSIIASSLDFGAAGASVVLNDEPDTEMIDSIRLGVTEVQRVQGLAPDDGILICTGDQPGLATAEVARCCEMFQANPKAIVVAAHDGKRGHPLIFPASLIPFVMSSACDNGLRELAQAHSDLMLYVECPGSAVLRNINTQSDYDNRSSN